MALMKASLVMMSDGRRFSSTIPTILRPVRYAICPRSRYGPGIAADPVSVMPRASAKEFIDVAVPIVLQWPADGAEEQVRSTEGDKIVQVTPAGLRDDADTEPLGLSESSNNGHAKARMIDIRITAYNNYVAASPAQIIHLAARHWQIRSWGKSMRPVFFVGK